MPQEQSMRALRALIQATSRVSGAAFFDALTLNLTRALGVKHAVLGELYGPGQRASRTRSVVFGGAWRDNFIYQLEGTPCDTVIQRGEIVHYSDNVAARFPQDAFLGEAGIRAYMGTVLKGSDGGYLGLLIIMHDAPIDLGTDPESILLLFAERAAAELQEIQSAARLRESEQTLRLALDAAKMRRWVLRGEALSWSGAQPILEPEPRTLTALLEALEVGERQRLQGALRRALTGEALDLTCQLKARLDAPRRWVRLKGHTTQGAELEMSGVALDETHSVQRTARAHEHERSLSLGRLAGGIAHDLNNLLTVITMNINLDLLEAEGGEEDQAIYTIVLEAATRMRSLIKQLETIARQQEIVPSEFEPNQTLESLGVLLKSLMGEGVELRLSLDEAAPSIFMDHSQFEQIFLNLAKNAAEAMPEGGIFELTSEHLPESGEVRFQARDTGHGIPAEILSRIIEPFYSTKSKQGRGLGVSICYSAVQRAGGTMEVHSEVGRGTIFEITLPTARRTRRCGVLSPGASLEEPLDQ